jgi:hypothetical protein
VSALLSGYKITGKEPDSESNLDSFGAPYGDFSNPQSLILYAYVKIT